MTERYPRIVSANPLSRRILFLLVALAILLNARAFAHDVPTPAPRKPMSLSLPSATFFLERPGATERIYVNGQYPNQTQQELTASSTGTTYVSSDKHVIEVDREGNVRAAGFGTAVVTIKNSGLKTFATFWVEDPTHPLPPVDVTRNVAIKRMAPQITAEDPTENRFDQTLRITNAMPIRARGLSGSRIPQLDRTVTVAVRIERPQE